MSRKSREYGMMLGITIGFAVWGCVLSAELRQSAALTAGSTVQQEIQTMEELKLHAGSAVLMDGDSGRILYEKEGMKIRPMASTTKIMTCILALENGNEADICTVSEKAAGQPKVHLGAPSGTQFLLEDMLYSLMLESHNDSAVVIAEHIAGNTDAFADLMNQKARDIGCADTFFITPNGLDSSVKRSDGTEIEHSTTAADLARIMRYCVKDSPAREKFLKITQTPSYTFSDLSGKRSYSCVNHNALLTMEQGAVSGKTGFTGKAGYSYVGAVEHEGRCFVIALLGCGWPPHKRYKWEDAKILLKFGKEHFHYQNIYKELVLEPLKVEHGKNGMYGDAVELVVGTECAEKQIPYLLAESERVEIEVELPDRIQAPVQAGMLVGAVKYRLAGQVIDLEPIYAKETIEKADILDKILRFFEKSRRMLKK